MQARHVYRHVITRHGVHAGTKGQGGKGARSGLPAARTHRLDHLGADVGRDARGQRGRLAAGRRLLQPLLAAHGGLQPLPGTVQLSTTTQRLPYTTQAVQVMQRAKPAARASLRYTAGENKPVVNCSQNFSRDRVQALTSLAVPGEAGRRRSAVPEEVAAAAAATSEPRNWATFAFCAASSVWKNPQPG